MPLLVWIALLMLLFALTAGSVHVFLRARGFWRTLKSLGPPLDGDLRDLTGSLERLTAGAEAMRGGTPQLDASLERLRRSLARLAVLRAAVQDARDSFTRLAAVYPRK
jgi:hypothetical protein